LAHNRYLGEAVQRWAFCGLTRSAWARQFYDANIAAGKSHYAALRALGNRWLEVLWHRLRLSVTYDEATHTTNRDGPTNPPRAVDRGCLTRPRFLHDRRPTTGRWSGARRDATTPAGVRRCGTHQQGRRRRTGLLALAMPRQR
jgi:hypothetical protein